MSHGWTPERRARKSVLIQGWNSWARSTGPQTDDGKARSARNSQKHGTRSQRSINEMRLLRELIRECRGTEAEI